MNICVKLTRANIKKSDLQINLRTQPVPSTIGHLTLGCASDLSNSMTSYAITIQFHGTPEERD
jgi:hypothetical protein